MEEVRAAAEAAEAAEPEARVEEVVGAGGRRKEAYIAASVLATAGDDDFEDEVMVEVNPGDPRFQVLLVLKQRPRSYKHMMRQTTPTTQMAKKLGQPIARKASAKNQCTYCL